MTTMTTLPVGPVRVHDLDFAGASDEVLKLAAARSGQRAVVVTPNGQHLDLLRREPALVTVYRRAELVLPDGWPVVLAMKWRGAKASGRVTGADLLPSLCRHAASSGLTVGLVGGKPDVAARAAQRLTARYPGLKVTLTHSPPMGFERDDEACRQMAALVAEAGVQLLFLGLGAPKQELFADLWLRSSGPGVTLCVGAAIDFVAGEQVRAPELWRRLGLEWLHRLLREPRRLSGRYMKTIPVICGVLVGAGVDFLCGRSR
ncbi:MAG: WecB/TagA/CpsF family glycosyltransferase [Kutzneria sp.]|nr:WecB/TagA/CpsF family glycosyltransferase [Kutzneria sp.]